MNSIKEISAGGVVLNKIAKNSKIILISRKDGKIWCLPKGKIEHGEEKRQTALREVKEETGVNAEIIEKLDKINYWFYKNKNLKCFKTVYFYIMKYKIGSINNNSPEVDDVGWFNIDKALLKMSYESEKKLVAKVKKMLCKNH